MNICKQQLVKTVSFYKEQWERQKYNLKSFIFVVAFISAGTRLVCHTLDVRSLWNMPLLCRYCSPRAISRDRAILTPHDRYRSLSNSCSRLPPFMYCTERDDRVSQTQARSRNAASSFISRGKLSCGLTNSGAMSPTVNQSGDSSQHTV